MTSALGIIAGANGLPVDLAGRCAAEGRAFFTIRLKGLADPALAVLKTWFDDHVPHGVRV